MVPRLAAIAVAVWFVMLCVLPDPRPLGAPEWAVRLAGRLGGLGDPAARLLATAVLRAAGVGCIGVLLAVATSAWRGPVAAGGVLVGAPLLALLAKRVNFGTFPLWQHLVFILGVAFLGALVGLALRRNRAALLALVGATCGLAAWGGSTRVPADLDAASQATARHVLDRAADVPDGDAGFLQTLRIAFAYAEDNSHGTDAVLPNRAAILALGTILGDDSVARVGGTDRDGTAAADRSRLRQRIRLGDRNDLSRHFWVSAALTVLADEQRALAVGLAKEVKDSTPGGSGFSFIDMAANKAGIRLAAVATRDTAAAHAFQARVARGLAVSDILPAVTDLPEGLARDDIQGVLGGLGGAETRRLLDEIDRRIAALPLGR